MEIVFKTVECFRGFNFRRYNIKKGRTSGKEGFMFKGRKVSLPRIGFRKFTFHAKSTSWVKLEVEIIGYYSLGNFPYMNHLEAFSSSLKTWDLKFLHSFPVV